MPLVSLTGPVSSPFGNFLKGDSFAARLGPGHDGFALDHRFAKRIRIGNMPDISQLDIEKTIGDIAEAGKMVLRLRFAIGHVHGHIEMLDIGFKKAALISE